MITNNSNNNNKPMRSNGRNSKDNNNQNSETSLKYDTKNATNNKDNKRYDKPESKDRKRDESKGIRRGKINSFKFDTSNCSQREKLMQEIDSGKLECLVCCEKIKPFHSTWSCTSCYHIMHLNCIIKWAASSKDDEGTWRCCACNKLADVIPSVYFCFCGKQKDPQYNRTDVAHSCGETCGRLDRLDGCEHPCTQLCHPGPCPPCQVNSET